MSTDRIVDDYLADILEAISDIRSFTEGLDYEAFRKDRKTSNAVIRSLEVIGEAVKNIPVEARQLSPALPWKEIAGMRQAHTRIFRSRPAVSLGNDTVGFMPFGTGHPQDQQSQGWRGLKF